MRAIVIDTPGPQSSLRLAELPDPTPAPDELLIRVAAAGVNRADLVQRAGRYAPPPGASEILGLEVAGTVAAVGAEVAGWRVGDRVWTLLGGGGYAELVACPAALAMPLPEQLSFVDGAALVEVCYTALLNLVMLGGLGPGQRALIHAGASGVGMAAIQIARLYGASAAVTVGSPAKAQACLDLGAELAILYKEQDFLEQVRGWSPEGVNVILDPVGGPYLERNLSALDPDGVLIVIGLMGGRAAELDLGRLMAKRLSVRGSTLRALPLERKLAVRERFLADLLPAILDGRLRPTIDGTYPLEDAEQAHAVMAANQNAGKLVLTLG